MLRLAFACNVIATLSLVGCATNDIESEEDADAAAAGKSDDAGFRFGPYTAFDPTEGINRMPLIAVFHAPDRDVRAGDSGHFDLTRLKGDYESTYDSGTFKLYTWQGRNRIRFTTYDGRVILRADWKYENNGLVLGETTMFQGIQLPEELIDCVAVEIIDSGVLEEGLSVNEYPDVSVDKAGTNKFDLDIGAASITHDEATVTVKTTNGVFEATGVTTQGETYTIRVPEKAPRRGEILYKSDGEESTLATIVCR